MNDATKSSAQLNPISLLTSHNGRELAAQDMLTKAGAWLGVWPLGFAVMALWSLTRVVSFPQISSCEPIVHNSLVLFLNINISLRIKENVLASLYFN